MSDKDDRHTSATRSRYWATAIAIAVMLLGAEATSWAAGASESATAGRTEHVASAPKEAATLPPPPSMDQRYAARETSSKTLETFKGGDVVVVGSSALVIILLVVLIIVII